MKKRSVDEKAIGILIVCMYVCVFFFQENDRIVITCVEASLHSLCWVWRSIVKFPFAWTTIKSDFFKSTLLLKISTQHGSPITPL